ncbi:MAG TPA: bifunctional serine/threonine-protein kinase/universal stress protein [Casimicrobiaceae bacterium]
MTTSPKPSDLIGGFRIENCSHVGGNGYIYRVAPPPGIDPPFPLMMKMPGVGRGEPPLGVVSFEIEWTILPRLSGPFVPQVVAVGELDVHPFIVMEEIVGEGLTQIVECAPLPIDQVAAIGAAIADALHSIHQQEVIHFDLKPENVILRANGEAVLLDFGFARHAHYPDLLAEQLTFAAGSAAYVSPEQLQKDRSDSRSDLFALGVLLFQLATGELPFGEPETYAGMRDRLWRAPAPPRSVRPEVPPWLQEVILRCLERYPARRYQTAAHIAFDLRHPDQVPLTKRAELRAGASMGRQLWRWWRSLGHAIDVSSPRGKRPDLSSVILVAVDTEHPEDRRHAALQEATRAIVSLHADFRLMFVSVIRAAELGEGARIEDTASGKHLEHRKRLRRWVEPLGLTPIRTSLHVIMSDDPAATLLELAHANHVDLIVLGAPGPSQRAFAWWRSAASTITANAACSVYVVRAVAEAVEAALENEGSESLD